MSARDGGSASGDARRYAALPESFALYRGGVLRHGTLAYETWGELNAARSNAILLFTGLSPSAHAASSAADPRSGWWEAMLGPGKAIDTKRHFVVCVNSLGSCFGSSGPASIDPATGERYGLAFPEIGVEDIASSAHALLGTLGIRSLHAVIGASLGGMSVLAFAARHPHAARRLVSISATAAASPFAIALRAVQREAVLGDPLWHGGRYAPERPPRAGLVLARKLGTITYRSAAEWQQRFGRAEIAPAPASLTGLGPRFAVEAYLEAQAQRWAAIFDANCYLYLARAMDRFDLAEHGGSAQAALAGARAEAALVIGVQTDLLFPIAEQQFVASALSAAGVPTTFTALNSLEGHDAFLVDVAQFDPALRRFLA